MKITFNITTDKEDLNRYSSADDLRCALKGFSGVELMHLGNDANNIILPEFVVGLHMSYFPFWLDFYKGTNPNRIKEEFDTFENAYNYYGGTDKLAIINKFKADLKNAHRFGAEYVVFHVSESSTRENFSFDFHYADEEVIDASAEILNTVFENEDGNITLLVENLWQSGFTFTRKEITKRLLEKIKYKNKGIMLDTGHLMHTDTSLKSQEDGLEYILKMLDEHDELCKFIRGVHLHQSITSEYINNIKANPPELSSDYEERTMQMFMHAFSVDKHLPFTAKGVDKLIKRISPEYLTFEFMTVSREEHILFLNQQKNALTV